MSADHALVIASDAEHPGMARVWGSGAWTPPDEREARDWFTLCRLLGWEARLETPRLGRVADGARWVLVACDPGEMSDGLASALDAFLDRSPGLVVRRTPRRGPDLTGRTLRWLGPGEGATWKLDHDLRATRLEGDGDPWLTLDDAPVALAERRGRGTLLALGFHPSEARDAGIAATAALRTLLTRGPDGGTTWLDTDGLFALRMDDPGGSQNVHLDWFRYPELGPATWRELAALLRERNARLGVAAVPGWADDGETARGELRVGGEKGERVAGRIHPSWEVTYRDRAGVLHDYVGEFATLRELAREGLVDIALHGLTHVQPDAQAWIAADDRYTADWWYCEFAAAGTRGACPAGRRQRRC